MPAPISNSALGTDILPLRGYTVDQLAAYIERQLGLGVFSVELTKAQIVDQIYNALQRYSVYRPRPRYGAVALVSGQFEYLTDFRPAFGVVDVWFVNPYPLPTNLYWGNLISPGPLTGVGIDEYDSYMRWLKTWLRVTSSQPDWLWDEGRNVLFIHNPMEMYQAGVLALDAWETTQSLDGFGAMWVKDYSYQLARLQLAEILSKFSGAIPGPAQALQLDQQKRDKAEAKLKEMEEKLVGAQWSIPVNTD
jgi:hypothetical protein